MNVLRILVVDDDHDFAEMIADVLVSRGHKVELAFSGEEALTKAEEFDFDLAFMDVGLPGIDGVESFLTIRKRKPNARVIMMTGFTMEEMLDKAKENGAWAILKKPIHIPDILKKVDEISPTGSILIVDDDLDFAASIQQALEIYSYSTVAVPAGKEAIEEAKKDETQLVLLDLRLPDMNGYEVFTEIRKTNEKLPIIILTAYPEEEADKISFMNASSNTGVMIKPIDPTVLYQTIEDLMAQSIHEDSDHESRGNR